MNGPRYPKATVKLSGTDGNAFAILGAVRTALRAAGVPAAQIAEFNTEATSGNYDHLLATCMRWVNVR